MQHRACFEATPVDSAALYRSNLFAADALFPRCFFLSTDTDVGGSKQKRVLLSKTCYQTCTRMYRFDNRSQKPHLHYTSGKKDFRFNRCPEERIVTLWIKTICFHLKKNILPFNTAMDGGGSNQYHVSLSAKHDLKPVQGCTDLR